MEGQFLGRGCTGLVQGLQGRCTESWAWTQNPREQNASCAPGIPVETIEAKVKPRRNQPDPAYLALGSFGSARARAYPRAQRDWDSGLQERLRYCLAHGAVGACSFINSLRTEVHLLAPTRSGASPVAVQASRRLVTPARE